MPDLECLLRAHFARYPLMTAQDAVKLLYQRAFGAEHVIDNPAASLAWLTDERSSTLADADVPLCDPIGNGLARMHLAALPQDVSDQTVNTLFVFGAVRHQGLPSEIEHSLQVLHSLAQAGATPFSLADTDTFLSEYRKNGCPSVRHSMRYRAEYRPAYRVMPLMCAQYLRLFAAIDALLAKHPFVRVAIDGNAASGKTTLASFLQEVYQCPVIHMDDFFLPLEKRTRERMQEPGGNVDYERFAEEVLPYLQSRQPFSYRVFDCSVMALTKRAHVPAASLIITEGSYSLHPSLKDAYDLCVFLSCSAQTQRARILNRNGDELLARFESEWIPLENTYFAAYSIPEDCDLVFSA